MLTKVEGTIKATVESRSLLMSSFSKTHQGPFGEKKQQWVCNVSITQLPDPKADHVLLPLHHFRHPKGLQATTASEQQTKSEGGE